MATFSEMSYNRAKLASYITEIVLQQRIFYLLTNSAITSKTPMSYIYSYTYIAGLRGRIKYFLGTVLLLL